MSFVASDRIVVVPRGLVMSTMFSTRLLRLIKLIASICSALILHS